MKTFFKNLAASFIGALLALALACVFFIMLLGSLTAFTAGTDTVIPSSAILKIDFGTSIGEQSVEEPFDMSLISPMATATSSTVGILKLVQAVNYAATDPAVKFIYMNTELADNCSLSHLEELRNALSDFRLSGKPVIAFAENFSQKGYYIASVADKIYAAPLGMTEIIGVSAQVMFFKGALDMLGVDVQLIRHGKYKSAGEQFINSDISDANREQNQAMISSLWNTISTSICKSRGLEVAEFNKMVDDLTLSSPEALAEAGLIDEVCSKPELSMKLCDLFGVEKEEDVKMVAIDKYAKARVKPNVKAADKIAIIYADGDIVSGSGDGISSDKFAGLVSKVRKDKTVKAVVLRVNSPGGSSLAAEIIRTELNLLKEEKPLIASFCVYAASGGYWISAGVDKIYTDETTLTGSIGVFSMIPSFGKVLDKVHVNPVSISSNKHSDMFSLYRKFDDKEVAFMQKGVEVVYDKFLSIVSEGRSMEPSEVDKIAQGRVWTGSEALKINLADEKGGIIDAIKYAAIAADIEDYNLVEYPVIKNTMEKLMESLGETQATIQKVSDPEKELTELYNSIRNDNGIYARIPYNYSIR